MKYKEKTLLQTHKLDRLTPAVPFEDEIKILLLVHSALTALERGKDAGEGESSSLLLCVYSCLGTCVSEIGNQ